MRTLLYLYGAQFLANESLSQFGRSLGAVKSEATAELHRQAEVITALQSVRSRFASDRFVIPQLYC